MSSAALMVRDGMVARVCLVKGVLAIGDNGLIAWRPTLLQRSYGLTPVEVGGYLVLAVSVIGGALSDWMARRFGVATRVVLLAGCYGLAVPGAALVCFSTTGGQAALALGIWAFGSIGAYVIGHVVMQENVPREMRATTIALSMTIIGLIGIGLGPMPVPLVAAGLGGALQGAMAMVGLAAALAACLVIGSPIRAGLAALKAGPPPP
jgi:hypothetical protein